MHVSISELLGENVEIAVTLENWLIDFSFWKKEKKNRISMCSRRLFLQVIVKLTATQYSNSFNCLSRLSALHLKSETVDACAVRGFIISQDIFRPEKETKSATRIIRKDSTLSV